MAFTSHFLKIKRALEGRKMNQAVSKKEAGAVVQVVGVCLVRG